MKLKYIGVMLLVLFVITLPIYVKGLKAERDTNCTNFMASYNKEVLFGNSEDSSGSHPLYKNPDGTIIWFLPATDENYGMMQIGWYWQETHISYQGGINEFGLCYDSTAIPELDLNDYPEKPYNKQNSYKWRDILGKCKNIEDAVQYIEQYDFKEMWFQIFLTDTSGNAVIVSPNFEGELEFTYKGINNGYLAQTNFNRIHPDSHYGTYPCPRYQSCCMLLSNIQNEDTMTTDYFETILSAVHQSTYNSYTPYSNIYNPNTKMIYLYYVSQFYEPIKLDLVHELSLGEHEYYLCDLVSEKTHENGMKYYKKTILKSILLKGVIISGVLIIIGIGVYVFLRRKRKKNNR